MEDIILIGFGGHAKSMIDSIEKAGIYRIIGYTDIKAGSEYHGYKWLGADDVLSDYYNKGIHSACIGIGYMGEGRFRDKLYKFVKEIGYNLPVIIDPTAILSNAVNIGEGTYIGKGAIINSGSCIGKMCIINTGVLVEHENVIGDFSHLAVRAVLSGNVRIGSHCLVGANSTIIQGKCVGKNVKIGAGAVIIDDLPDNTTAVGVPARIVDLGGHK